jgi:hypothetical protein
MNVEGRPPTLSEVRQNIQTRIDRVQADPQTTEMEKQKGTEGLMKMLGDTEQLMLTAAKPSRAGTKSGLIASADMSETAPPSSAAAPEVQAPTPSSKVFQTNEQARTAYEKEISARLSEAGIQTKITQVQIEPGKFNTVIKYYRDGKYLGESIRSISAGEMKLSTIGLNGKTGALRPIYSAESQFAKDHNITVKSRLSNQFTRSKFKEFYPNSVEIKGGRTLVWSPPTTANSQEVNTTPTPTTNEAQSQITQAGAPAAIESQPPVAEAAGSPQEGAAQRQGENQGVVATTSATGNTVEEIDITDALAEPPTPVEVAATAISPETALREDPETLSQAKEFLQSKGISTEGLDEATIAALIQEESTPRQRPEGVAKPGQIHNELEKHNFSKGITEFLRSVAKTGEFRYKMMAKLLLAYPGLLNSVKVSLVNLPNSDYAGVYLPNGQILINEAGQGPRGAVDTVIHELIHGAMDRALYSPNAAQRKFIARLDRLRETVRRRAVAEGITGMEYALGSNDEFITHWFTSPKFQENVGRLTQKGERNLVQVILDTIKSIFTGKPVSQIERSINALMDEMLTFTKDALETTWGQSRMDQLMSQPESYRNTSRREELQAKSVVSPASPVIVREEQSLSGLSDSATIEDIQRAAPTLVHSAALKAAYFRTEQAFTEWAGKLSEQLGRFAKVIWANSRLIISALVIQFSSPSQVAPQIDTRDAAAVVLTSNKPTISDDTEFSEETFQPSVRPELQVREMQVPQSFGRIDIDQPEPLDSLETPQRMESVSPVDFTREIAQKLEGSHATTLPADLATYWLGQGNAPQVDSMARLLYQNERSSKAIKDMLVSMGIDESPSTFPWCATCTSWALNDSGVRRVSMKPN